MDLDFDDLPSGHAAPVAKAGARFKPRGRPQPKKKQVSLPISRTTLPNDVAKETLSTQTASASESIVPDSETINQSNTGTISGENVDVVAGQVNCYMKPSSLRACTNVGLEREGSDDDDGIETAPAFLDDLRTQDFTTFEDFVTPGTDEVIHAQIQEMQEEECQVDMETLDIVQEECITSAYEQHTGKFQPKPRLFDTVIEEPESHDSVDDTGYFETDANEPEFMVDVEARDDFSTNDTFNELQEEQRHSHDVPRDMAPEMEAENAYGEQEHEVLPSDNNPVVGDTVEKERPGRKGKKGKSKGTTTRKRKTTSEDDPNKSSENPEKKKFKHATRRQSKRTLEKELLETPDDEIRYLPIRDMLRLVEYKEWLEKKEAKSGAGVPPVQESNMNASGNQYHSQGFDAEDEFGIEESENQEANVVKPDSPVNYQTYMKKTPRSRWSKQDTELFYEGILEFGSNLSMVQQLFPDRTREQIKLKFKLEERRNPLKLNDALSSRSKHLTHFQNVIKKLQQEAAAAREGEEGEEEEAGTAEAETETETTTTDAPESEEPPATKPEPEESERAGNEEVAGGDECDDEGDDDFWNSYKSDM